MIANDTLELHYSAQFLDLLLEVAENLQNRLCKLREHAPFVPVIHVIELSIMG